MTDDKKTELLKQVYLAYIRFDNAVNAKPLNTHEINVAYAWLDSVMSHIYDEVGSELGVDKLPPLEESEDEGK